MTKQKSLKRALISSVLALALCFTMLIGTTYAWFTDSVTSANNVIKSGTLEIEFTWAKGNEDPTAATTAWTDASKGPIFNNQLWEPGYTEARHFKLKNVGTLALKYQFAIVPNGEVSELADVIDVYLYDGTATQVANRAALDESKKIGTLADLINDGIKQGNLAAGAEYTATIVLKMQESAGNEYQNLSIGSDFAIRVLATQYTAENDSFNNKYDEDAWHPDMLVMNARDLRSAIANADAGDVIALAADIVVPEGETIEIPANSNITIDLNGKTLTYGTPNGLAALTSDESELPMAVITVKGAVKFKNGSIVTSDGVGGILASGTSANVIIENVTVDANGDRGAEDTWNASALQVSGGAKMIVNSGTFSSETGCGFIMKTSGGEATINGGIFTTDAKRPCAAIRVDSWNNNNTLTVNDGIFNATAENELAGYFDGYEYVYIKGGTFNGQIDSTYQNIEISGGTFNETIVQTGGHQNKYIITGGTFCEDVSAYAAENYAVVSNGNGSYTVLPEVEDVTLVATDFEGVYADSAKVNTYYIFDKTGLMNLNALFAKNKPNEANINTVNLMADVDLAGEAWEPICSMWVTFDGHEHTISNITAGMAADGRRSGFWSYAGAVTIKNLTLDNVNVAGSQVGTFAGGADGLKVENCFLKGTNTVTYVDGVEDWNGIGAITGVTISSNINVEIVDGATVTLNRGAMYTSYGCVYVDDLTGHIQANGGTVTNNGKVNANGKCYYVVTKAEELAAAAEAGFKELYLADGEYDVYGCGGKTLTLNGSKDAVIKLYNDGEDGCDYGFGSAGTGVGNYTFNGLTIDTTANTGSYKGFAYMKGTFNDCSFVGAYSLNNANDFVFNRCEFDFKNGYFWTWGAESVTFNDCTFNGNSKAILAHGYASTVININNCDFAATEKGYTGAGDNTAVVEIDPAGSNVYTINFTGDNTKTDSYAGWTRVKDGSTGHVISNPTEVSDASGLDEALTKGENIELTDNLTIKSGDTSSNSGYGATGVTVDNGSVFDGNGNTLTVNDANGSWDCAINPKNGTIQNVTVTGAFRGIFMGSASGDVYIDNVIINDVIYTFNSDGGSKDYGVYISDSTLNGWTSHSDVHKEVVYTNCNFGEGNGYAFCRPYGKTILENCVFEEGFKFDTSMTSDIVFINCYYGDTLITAENAASLGNGETTFFFNGLNGITIQ